MILHIFRVAECNYEIVDLAFIMLCVFEWSDWYFSRLLKKTNCKYEDLDFIIRPQILLSEYYFHDNIYSINLVFLHLRQNFTICENHDCSFYFARNAMKMNSTLISAFSSLVCILDYCFWSTWIFLFAKTGESCS